MWQLLEVEPKYTYIVVLISHGRRREHVKVSVDKITSVASQEGKEKGQSKSDHNKKQN